MEKKKNHRMPKFKKGDEVKNWGNSRAVVERFIAEAGEYKYEVTFRNTGRKDILKESDIFFWNFDIEESKRSIGEVPEKCPRCGSQWTITRFGAKKWYDCAKCKKNAEDLVNSWASTSKMETKYDEYDQLLLEFEQILGFSDDDDGDGYF